MKNNSDFVHTSSNINCKSRKCVTRYACIDIRTFDVPLTNPATGSPLDSVRLDPDRIYTIGRAGTDGNCDFIFDDRRVSKQHCQIFYDSVLSKIYILDGVLLLDRCNDSSVASEYRSRVVCCDELEGEGMEGPECGRVRVSMNGVFVNGVRARRATARELCAGDEVCFACNNEEKCSLRVHIGFVIVGLSFKEEVIRGAADIRLESPWLDEAMMPIRHSQGSVSSGIRNKRVFAIGGYDAAPGVDYFSRSKRIDIVGRAKFLLNHCRHILQSNDPMSCIRQHDLSYCVKEIVSGCKFFGGGEMEVNSSLPVSMREVNLCQESHLNQKGLDRIQSKNVVLRKIPESSLLKSNDKGSASHADVLTQKKTSRNYCTPPGKSFYLNRLQFMERDSFGFEKCISLPELLHPIESISRLFIATFTSDILWFLSYCEIPHHLPVTIACHNAERCWSSSLEKRTVAPYPDFPNLVVVFPQFPEAIAFGNDRKRQGIACHHPKLLVLQREDSIRVVITSANLVANQWRNVTNTVWWQDFPSRSDPDLLSLFTQVSDEVYQDIGSDFAAQLAGFMASLVVDVPSQAHWIVELTKYNFEGATGHLIASVPGIHSWKIHYVYPHEFGSLHAKFLGSVEASVVGLSHLFHNAADRNGSQLKKLATFLGKSHENAYGMTQVVLRRNFNVPVDANCVSVLVSNSDHSSEEDCIQLGFLPRYVAKWVSPLWDSGFFRFSGHVFAKEALASALGGSGMRVQLILHVSQGPHFPDMMKMMQPEHVIALLSLIASIQRCTGIWRLQEILGQFKWPEMEQSDFIYGSSSIGSSINAQFLAAFSVAAGKRSMHVFDSEESDPEWGCWSASQELRNPSIRIIFPTIERVKNACNGILPSRHILCFSEKTWQRLRSADILHDAVPHPHDRVGHPMHVKVARRRFPSKTDSSSFGWVYCGSHNFSAAAWGRTISNPFGPKFNDQTKTNSSMRLRVCNYELGIVFTFPPTETNCHTNSDNTNLDDIILPFVVPAPKYRATDRPATGKAMREALVELIVQEREKIAELSSIEDAVEEIPDEEEDNVEATDFVLLEKEDEKAYAEVLWSQVDSSQSC